MLAIIRRFIPSVTRNRIFFAIGALSVFLLIVVLVFFPSRSPSSLTPDTVTKPISAQREAMSIAIRKEGGVRAYIDFQKAYESAGFNTGHTAAHIFGEELYKAEHLSGTRVCDGKLNFGCFHGLLSKAISTEGLEVIAKLDSACIKNAGERSYECQHGIGHGILEYIGHTHVVDALNACKATRQGDPVAGCTSGVFMEYNFPIVVDEENSTAISNTRELMDKAKPYDLCPALEDPRFRISCYHELPQWWKQVYSNKFGELAKLCEAVVDTQEQHACFDGIAQMTAGTADYDVAASIALCREMPTIDVQKSCLRVVVSTFEVSRGDKESARRVCDAIPDVPATFCNISP